MIAKAIDTPIVSVIVPTRGRRGFLEAAVESALAQTVTDLEILVVDDEPTPGATLDFGGDSRVRPLASGGAGAAAARNRGLAVARGRAIAFLDDDDLWHREKLELELRAFADEPQCELVYCPFERQIEATGERQSTSVPNRIEWRDLLRSTFFGCSVPLIRRAALVAVGGFDENLPGSQDRDLWLRLRRRRRFAFVDRSLVTVRVHPGQMSGRLEAKIAAKRRLLAKHAVDYAAHPREHAHQLTRLGMMLSAAGRPWRAAACFLGASRRDREARAPRELLRELLQSPDRQRRRLLADGFRRYGEVVHYW